MGHRQTNGNQFIIFMNKKNNETDKLCHRGALGKTVKFNSRSRVKGTSTSRKKHLKSMNYKQTGFPCNMFSKTFKKGQMPTRTLKNRFDQLVNDVFLKIDFQSSGYITFTKLSYCKSIPERVFYFFGGVFQKVRQLGGVSLKIFVKLCDEAFVQANIEDLEAILNSSDHETNKNVENSNQKGVKIQIKLKDKEIDLQEQLNYKQELNFSTKKFKNPPLPLPLPLTPPPRQNCSLRIKTQNIEAKGSFLNSYTNLKQSSVNKLAELSLTYHETSNTEQQQKQSISFQSGKVKMLTERLDRQIEYSKSRLFTNHFMR